MCNVPPDAYVTKNSSPPFLSVLHLLSGNIRTFPTLEIKWKMHILNTVRVLGATVMSHRSSSLGCWTDCGAFYYPFLCCPPNACFLLHLSPKQFWIVLSYLLPQILHELKFTLSNVFEKERKEGKWCVLQRTCAMSGGLGSLLGFTPPKSLPGPLRLINEFQLE